MEAGWASRRLVLGGSLAAELLYDPVGHGERVYIDGKLRAKTSGWNFFRSVAPHIQFTIPSQWGLVPCQIHVAASLSNLLRLTRFELYVAGKRIYQE